MTTMSPVSTLLFLSLILLVQGRKKTTTPPSLINQPKTNLYFKGDGNSERMELPCVALGEPKPEYRWERNGKELDVASSDHIIFLPGIGTITINDPKIERDEGYYQCFATNSYGTSVSPLTRIQKAVMETFSTVIEPKRLSPTVGYAETLFCNVPKSVPSLPRGQVRWAKRRVGSSDYQSSGTLQPERLLNSNRIIQDYEGNLRFTNIQESDRTKPGWVYMCMAENAILRSTVSGDDQTIEPQVIGGLAVTNVPIDIMWTSDLKPVALKGRKLQLKCIFSGTPTPQVSWTRKGKNPGAFERLTVTDFSHELTIENVDFTDGGEYQCHGINSVTPTPYTKTFNVKVQASPYWIDAPKDVIKGVEENAQFMCNVGGDPIPSIKWYINGVPIDQAEINLRRRKYTRKIVFTNLTQSDQQVLQCNASNKHGYLWADVFLNVLAEKAEIIPNLLKDIKVAVGQSLQIPCNTTGKPTPTITWYKGSQVLSSQHFVISKDGTIFIQEVTKDDQGDFKCKANNRFGYAEQTTKVTVRLKTEIIKKTIDGDRIAGTDIDLMCHATTDPAGSTVSVSETLRLRKDEGTHLLYIAPTKQHVNEPNTDNLYEQRGCKISNRQEWRHAVIEALEKNLEVTWLYEGLPLRPVVARHRVDPQKLTLKIYKSIAADSGYYTCNVSNGVDSAQATIKILVKDVADKPTSVMVSKCWKQVATIQWKNGSDNNALIQKYIVQYNTSFTPKTWKLGSNAVADARTATVTLSPYANYTFRVIAANGVGLSEPSDVTTVCHSTPSLPVKQPTNVNSPTNKKKFLQVSWDKMAPIDHNGPEYRYFVTVKKVGGTKTLNRTVTDYKTTHTMFPVNTVYEPYEVTVQSINSVGVCMDPAKSIIGYSGEDEPTLVPKDFRKDPAKNVTATSASFIWTGVDVKSINMYGKFNGYRIQYWKRDDPDKAMTTVEVHSANERRRRAISKTERHTISSLPPYSNITLQVAVANSHYTGPPSNQVHIETPEGVPSAVPYLMARIRGANHFVITWGEPKQHNGVLIGYDVEYQKNIYCPTNGRFFNGLCLTINPCVGECDVDEGLEYCQRVNKAAKLARVNSGAMNTFIVDKIPRNTKTTMLIIDGKVKERGGDREWVDSDGVRLAYSNWIDDASVHKCVAIQLKKDVFGKWKDISCLRKYDNKISFVCQMDQNECAKDNGGCKHYCTNSDGSYACSCEKKYVLMSDKHGCKREIRNGKEWNKKLVDHSLGAMSETIKIRDVDQRYLLLEGLLNDQQYRVSIWALTRIGRSKVYYIDVITGQGGDPATPHFLFDNIKDTSFNVTWHKVSETGETMGYHHHVEYRRSDERTWIETKKETIQLWQEVENLTPGTQYDVRVVASMDTGPKKWYSPVQHATTTSMATTTPTTIYEQQGIITVPQINIATANLPALNNIPSLNEVTNLTKITNAGITTKVAEITQVASLGNAGITNVAGISKVAGMLNDTEITLPTGITNKTTNGTTIKIGDCNTTNANISGVTLSYQAPVIQDIGTAGWFIGMMVVIALLLLILIIVCIIKRNRGDKYHVQEKERLRGADLDNGHDFSPYHDNDDQSIGKKSGGSADIGGGDGGSDVDSMEEYAGVDPSKFNEDGSFIGQYGDKVNNTENERPPMSTFM